MPQKRFLNDFFPLVLPHNFFPSRDNFTYYNINNFLLPYLPPGEWARLCSEVSILFDGGLGIGDKWNNGSGIETCDTAMEPGRLSSLSPLESKTVIKKIHIKKLPSLESSLAREDLLHTQRRFGTWATRKIHWSKNNIFSY